MVYSFADICRLFQPSHLKNHEFNFSTKHPTKQFSNAVVHRQTWPCAKPTELKTFVHQEFYGIHLRTFVGHSNPHISKNLNLLFHKHCPSSHLAMSWCTDQLGHVQNPPNFTFVLQDFHGIHLGTFVGHFNPHISKATNFIFSQKNPPSHLHMPWCTDQLGHVQNPPNSKLSCTKTFMVFIWGHL